jgi:hypothetical protein
MKKIIGNPSEINNKLINLIKKTKINDFYLKNKFDFRDQILNDIEPDDEVLDIGKAMRDKFKIINCKNLETLDVNIYDNYPDIVCDLCSDVKELKNKYNKIICIAILEHVYDPFKAVSNLRLMIKEGGKIYGMVPYLYSYHAPSNLKFQDYFRFSKDALSYLFKDFSHVELFPIRGRIPSSLFMIFGKIWKNYIEKTNLNIFLNNLISNDKNFKQCSGFNFILTK